MHQTLRKAEGSKENDEVYLGPGMMLDPRRLDHVTRVRSRKTLVNRNIPSSMDSHDYEKLEPWS